MTALHVVRQDLQSWRTVDKRFFRKEEVLVDLSGDRLLGVLPDVDVPVEHAARLPSQDAAVQLEARARRGGVVDPRVVVRLLGPGRHEIGRASCRERVEVSGGGWAW